MDSNIGKYSLLAIKIVISLAFIAAGLSKLAGVEMQIAIFDTIGVGQWFRYVTGIIEISGVILLWMPGRQFYGAALLAIAMVGAIISHLLYLGTATMGPATILLVLASFVAYSHRDQITA